VWSVRPHKLQVFLHTIKLKVKLEQLNLSKTLPINVELDGEAVGGALELDDRDGSEPVLDNGKQLGLGELRRQVLRDLRDRGARCEGDDAPMAMVRS
jgi:hypothetical protein